MAISKTEKFTTRCARHVWILCSGAPEYTACSDLSRLTQLVPGPPLHPQAYRPGFDALQQGTRGVRLQ